MVNENNSALWQQPNVTRRFTIFCLHHSVCQLDIAVELVLWVFLLFLLYTPELSMLLVLYLLHYLIWEPCWPTNISARNVYFKIDVSVDLQRLNNKEIWYENCLPPPPSLSLSKYTCVCARVCVYWSPPSQAGCHRKLFLSRILLAWIQRFHFFRQVAIPRLKNPS